MSYIPIKFFYNFKFFIKLGMLNFEIKNSSFLIP